MTYSIVARDPDTGHLGVAVASRFFAVGALVAHIRANAAVATQAFVNPLWGIEGADRLARGQRAQMVMDDLVARDGGQAQRQAHMIDAAGLSVAHTGAGCVDWAGHAVADGVSVAGNMLEGADVVGDTLAAYLDNMALPLAPRLLTAMEAGEAAGGDKRGRQSAALKIHQGEGYPWIDIRADDHADPLAELRRLLAVAGERFLFFADHLATTENFSGRSDRAALDKAIAEDDERRRALGIGTASYATTKTP